VLLAEGAMRVNISQFYIRKIACHTTRGIGERTENRNSKCHRRNVRVCEGSPVARHCRIVRMDTESSTATVAASRYFARSVIGCPYAARRHAPPGPRNRTLKMRLVRIQSPFFGRYSSIARIASLAWFSTPCVMPKIAKTSVNNSMNGPYGLPPLNGVLTVGILPVRR
jgi:hypothetical protein